MPLPPSPSRVPQVTLQCDEKKARVADLVFSSSEGIGILSRVFSASVEVIVGFVLILLTLWIALTVVRS